MVHGLHIISLCGLENVLDRSCSDTSLTPETRDTGFGSWSSNTSFGSGTSDIASIFWIAHISSGSVIILLFM